MARVALLLTKLCRFCPAQPMPVSGPLALSTIKLSGLRARKTDVIFFTNSHTGHQYPSYIWLADPVTPLDTWNTVLKLPTGPTVFGTLESSLTTNSTGKTMSTLHDCMTNRARSTIKALHFLGNSIHGLDWAQWHIIESSSML